MNNISFNQDDTCVTVATDDGHRIYNCEPFGEFYLLLNPGGKLSISDGVGPAAPFPTAMLKMLFYTTLTVIVPKAPSGNRTLTIYNLKQRLKICDLTFPLAIVDIKLNRKWLLVYLEVGQIHIYNMSCVRLSKVVDLTSVDVVWDFGAGDSSLLVLPLHVVNEKVFEGVDIASLIVFTKELHPKKFSLAELNADSKGWVLVYDTMALAPKLIYKAHDSPLARIAVSNDNTKIATASTKGTIIRVVTLDDNITITNLRRGHNPAAINALSFNQDNTILGVGSTSNTIHLFNLASIDPDMDHLQSSDDLNENLANLLISKQNVQEPYFSLKSLKHSLKNPVTKSIAKKLPYKQYWTNLIWEPPRRSFAFIRIPEPELHHHVDIGFTANVVLVALYLGDFYHYQLPSADRECLLLNRYSLKTEVSEK